MSTANELISKLTKYVIDPIILVVFALGFLVFVWGLVQFMWGMRAGEVQDEGKQHMLWGLVGMLIMVSVYGIVTLLGSTLGLTSPSTSSPQNDSTVNPYNLPFGGGP
jgi:dipeptide/tripeptide permease